MRWEQIRKKQQQHRIVLSVSVGMSVCFCFYTVKRIKTTNSTKDGEQQQQQQQKTCRVWRERSKVIWTKRTTIKSLVERWKKNECCILVEYTISVPIDIQIHTCTICSFDVKIPTLHTPFVRFTSLVHFLVKIHTLTHIFFFLPRIFNLNIFTVHRCWFVPANPIWGSFHCDALHCFALHSLFARARPEFIFI